MSATFTNIVLCSSVSLSLVACYYFMRQTYQVVVLAWNGTPRIRSEIDGFSSPRPAPIVCLPNGPCFLSSPDTSSNFGDSKNGKDMAQNGQKISHSKVKSNSFYSSKTIPSVRSPASAVSSESSPLFLPHRISFHPDDSIFELNEFIRKGALCVLRDEYSVIMSVVPVLALILFSVNAWSQHSLDAGGYIAASFVVGSSCSLLCGMVNLHVGLASTLRTTVSANRSSTTAATNGNGSGMGSGPYGSSFNVALRAGCCMGLVVTTLAVFFLYSTLLASRWEHFVYSSTSTSLPSSNLLPSSSSTSEENDLVLHKITDCAIGFGLGTSIGALFGRVTGGLFKASTDFASGQIQQFFPHFRGEDDCRNPGVIADMAGDLIGSVSGMSTDMLSSVAESLCACIVTAACSSELILAGGWTALMFPVMLISLGSLCSLVIVLFSLYIQPVNREDDVDFALFSQVKLSGLVLLPVVTILSRLCFPATFTILGVTTRVMTPTHVSLCVISGIAGAVAISQCTEYFTSPLYSPVKCLAEAASQGAAPAWLLGVAQGFRSAWMPVLVVASVMFVSFLLGDVYGVALASAGMLSVTVSYVTIDGFGPVCDNAAGLAEMAELSSEVRFNILCSLLLLSHSHSLSHRRRRGALIRRVLLLLQTRDKLNKLDSVGNTSAAMGKSFSMCSAALVSMSLLGAFVFKIRARESDATAAAGSGGSGGGGEGGGDYEGAVLGDLLQPLTVAFVFVGSSLPYWLSAMSIGAVLDASAHITEQCTTGSSALSSPSSSSSTMNPLPDYYTCMSAASRSSLRSMIPQTALIVLAPLLTGTFFGVRALTGLLIGVNMSALPLALFMSNAGSAWDNAKQHIRGLCNRYSPGGGGGGADDKSSQCRVIADCDAVGDALKDAAAPTLNVLMKLSAILSLVLVDFFYAFHRGHGLFGLQA